MSDVKVDAASVPASAAGDAAGASIPTDRAAFIARFGSVVEHSPWVADQAFADAPFGDAAELSAAFERALRAAPRADQIAVLNAHPELAAERAISPPSLTVESRGEQAGAGLDRLADDRRRALAALLAEYRERFGFPFIACVRDHGGDALAGLVAERVTRDPEVELDTALTEVAAIARHRITDLVEGAS